MIELITIIATFYKRNKYSQKIVLTQSYPLNYKTITWFHSSYFTTLN